jgi:hypothetical protein
MLETIDLLYFCCFRIHPINFDIFRELRKSTLVLLA